MAKEAKVGKRIKMFRDKLKMTLGDLSAKSGVSVAVIASIEDGDKCFHLCKIILTVINRLCILYKRICRPAALQI